MKMKLMVTAFLVFLHKEIDGSQRPMDLMADLTNDLGVCILQVQSTLQRGNVAFSPYGLASMSVLLFEGAAGSTALEIMRVMKLPWNTLLVRIGFRDINRHLKTYFKSDGFLRGLIMSRDNVCFHPSYQKMLRLYGFDEPDTALTYPCTGFVPYSPPPTSSGASTTESVNVSTSSSPGNTTDEVVTELTQTSQSVTVRNNLTSSPTIEAATSPELTQLETRTKSETPSSTLATENPAATPAAETITAEYSNTIAAIPANSEATILTGAATELPSLDVAESNARSTLPPSSQTTIKVEELNSSTATTTLSSLLNSSDITTIENDSYFSTTFEPNKFFDKNYTETFTADFTFPTSDTSESTTLETFPTDSTGSTLLPETSTIFSATLGFSPVSRLNITANYTLPTLTPLFNDSSVADIDFTTFTPFTSPLSSFEETDFGNSTFFNTLVNFIESSTQTVKDLIGFGQNSTTLESTTLPSTSVAVERTNSSDTSSSANQNSTLLVNATVPRNTTSASNAAFRSSMLKLDNASRISGEIVDPRILPKKSISESNENLNGAINIVAESSNADLSTFRTPPNYVNILSVKQSKIISSKYDIRSVKGSRLVRNVPVPSDQGYNNTAEIIGNFTDTLRKLRDGPRSVPTTQNFLKPGNNHSSYSISIRADAEGRIPAVGPTAAYADINDFNSDMRSVRSYGHGQPLDADWFATPDQNIIRVPVFSYSAILPFAYIEDLKSKVLEIPLDDYNYSLLLILPTPELSIDNLFNSLTRMSLRRIWGLLRPTPVYASVPKFSIISHINLRHALYQLGVRDIFHRYRADLSLMSPDSKLFVRSIEQVVTVYVDKFPSSVYPVPEKYIERQFIASHPFLYFVLDRTSGVSLVAGLLSNPSKHII